MDLKFYLIVNRASASSFTFMNFMEGNDEAEADTCNKPLKDTQAWSLGKAYTASYNTAVPAATVMLNYLQARLNELDLTWYLGTFVSEFLPELQKRQPSSQQACAPKVPP